MYRPKDTQERILHRFQISLGHLKKVISMVEGDEYCIDVIHQLQAVEMGLGKAEQLILKNHLENCVADSISKGRKDEAIKEVMSVFEKKLVNH